MKDQFADHKADHKLPGRSEVVILLEHGRHFFGSLARRWDLCPWSGLDLRSRTKTAKVTNAQI